MPRTKKVEVDQDSPLCSGDVVEMREWGFGNDVRTNITVRVLFCTKDVVHGWELEGETASVRRDLPLTKLVRVKARHEPFWELSKHWLRG